MQFLKYSLILALLPLAAFAQTKQYDLTGYIGVPGGESFTYKLHLKDSAGKLGGYSITYLDQRNDTRSTITATIDRAAKTLTFRETEIVYNNGFHSNAIMCLASATLVYKSGTKGMVLTGSIRTKDLSNTDCGGGTITFVNEDELSRLFATDAAQEPVATVAKPAVQPAPQNQYKQRRIVVSEEAPAPPRPAKPAIDEITTGTDKTYLWHTDEVVIDIWDGGHIDNDIITLLYNGKVVLAKHTLTAGKKQIRIPVSADGTDLLTIVADNEGNEAPNTANITLYDGDVKHDILAYNDRRQSATIKITRDKREH